jgi:hypothetical protein
VKAVFLVIYLLGAIGTAWCLSPRIAGGDRRAFLSVSSVLWPFTVTVFGVIVLLALLAHWYDRLAASLQTHVRDSSAALATYAQTLPIACPRTRAALVNEHHRVVDPDPRRRLDLRVDAD